MHPYQKTDQEVAHELCSNLEQGLRNNQATDRLKNMA